MKINLLVIRTSHPEALKQQYEMLGFQFVLHQHGKGLPHFAHEEDGFVFEIYPLSKDYPNADHSLRMGFSIDDMEEKMAQISASNWKIIQNMQATEWGIMSLIQDLDGRKIELKPNK